MTGSGTDKKLIGKTILVAEDVEMNQQLICHILGHLGAKVEVAANGEEALRKIKSRLYDCVLMDVQMPEMDGLDATREIRTAEAAAKSHIPIIAMTANAMAGDREMCINAGMDGYVSKPVKKDVLHAEISRVLQALASPQPSQGDAHGTPVQ